MGATEEPQGHPTQVALASAGDPVAAPDHCPQGMGSSTEVVARFYPSQPSQRQIPAQGCTPRGIPSPWNISSLSQALLPSPTLTRMPLHRGIQCLFRQKCLFRVNTYRQTGISPLPT